MKKYIKTVVAMIVIMPFLASCASYEPAKWEYEHNGITLNIKADEKLNLRDGTAHTLSLCIYQLKDPNAFQQLSNDIDGLYQLLECNVFNPSVAGCKRIIVNPGDNTKGDIDRMEGAKYVGIVAGYYAIDKDSIVRFYKVPVKKRGIFNRRLVPEDLEITLRLSPRQIITPETE